MRRVIQTLAVLALCAALLGAVFVGWGLYNVSARQGHFPGITWVIHTAFKQSVRLRAPDAEAVPDDLTDPDRVALGALHFQTACAFCHAVPGQVRSATPLSMNPTPPHISEAAPHWQPEQMFWIVNEGVKMTGMPHWPAEGRDDEVWSVVAYLNALAEDDVLERADVADEGGSATCTQCHGAAGESGNSFIPRLDILTPDQIADALTHYRSGARPSGFMQQAAAELSDSDITALSRKFGNASAPQLQTDDPSEGESAGAALAQRGTDDIPACTACHGPGRQADAEIAPVLSGQGQAYLESQLSLWRDGQRGGGARAHLMRKAAQNLTDEDIATLAAWFSNLRVK